MAGRAPALDSKNASQWQELVDKVGGVEAASALTRLKPDTLRRYMRPSPNNGGSIFHMRVLAKRIREAGGVPLAGGQADVMPAVRPSASGYPAPMPERTYEDKPRGFAPVESAPVPDFSALDEPDPGNLSFFPSLPARAEKASRFAPKMKPPTDQSPLTDKEHRDFRAFLLHVFPELCEWADTGIGWTNRERIRPGDQGTQAIWATIDPEEAAILVDAMLDVAKVNGQAAAAVRGIVWALRRAQVAMIIGPRFWRTLDFYADHGGFYLPMPLNVLGGFPNSRRGRRNRGIGQ